jgi:hypothetical protein
MDSDAFGRAVIDGGKDCDGAIIVSESLGRVRAPVLLRTGWTAHWETD